MHLQAGQATAAVARPAAANTPFQPNQSVRRPPTNGPMVNPAYVAPVTIPSTRPLCAGPAASTRIAVEVPSIMAPPMPWITRNDRSAQACLERVMQRHERVNIASPVMKILFLPARSAALPRGSSRTRSR
jgi:hypothetical protein